MDNIMPEVVVELVKLLCRLLGPCLPFQHQKLKNKKKND